ncbi:MAG: TIGR02221 family CRISPR-associated protein [Bdellovibrionota bacterium]
MRKLFISFLGIGDYKECIYKLDNFECETDFIQEALIKYYKRKEWKNSEHRIKIFYTIETTKPRENKETKKIEESNFDKIQKRLEKYKNDIDYILIKSGQTQNELWEIFNTVNNEIKDNDELYLDITHAFRYIPMLSSYLLNFARIQKNISIKHINYGAFEAGEEKTKTAPMKTAPIYELSLLDHWFDWSIALNTFKQSGNAKKLIELLDLEYTIDELPSDSKTNTKDAALNNKIKFKSFLKDIKKTIDNFSKAVALSNVSDAIKNVLEIKAKINEYRTENSKVLENVSNENPQSIVILDTIYQIEKEFVNIIDDNIESYLELVKWCKEHDLYQSSITILYEVLITYFVNKYSKKLDEIVKNLKETTKSKSRKQKIKRGVISGVLSIASKNEDFENSDLNKNGIFECEKLRQDFATSHINICKLYSFLGQIRNHINHAKDSENITGSLGSGIYKFINENYGTENIKQSKDDDIFTLYNLIFEKIRYEIMELEK